MPVIIRAEENEANLLECKNNNDELRTRVDEAIRQSMRRGSPFGDDAWTARTIRRFELDSTLRPHGRPRKTGNGS